MALLSEEMEERKRSDTFRSNARLGYDLHELCDRMVDCRSLRYGSFCTSCHSFRSVFVLMSPSCAGAGASSADSASWLPSARVTNCNLERINGTAMLEEEPAESFVASSSVFAPML